MTAENKTPEIFGKLTVVEKVIIGVAFAIVLVLFIVLGLKECDSTPATISTSNITALQEQIDRQGKELTQATYDNMQDKSAIQELQKQFAAIDLTPDDSRIDDLETRINQYAGDMSVALEKAYTFEKIGQLDQAIIQDLQRTFDTLSQSFAVLQANLNEKVQITNAIFGDKIYKDSNSMAADIYITIFNPSIYDIENAKIYLTLKVDRDIPVVNRVTISGSYVNYPWTFIGQDGQYLYFETDKSVWIPHNATTQCYLKLYMTFVTKPVDTATIESEVRLER